MGKRILYAIRFFMIAIAFSACSTGKQAAKIKYQPHYTIDSVWDVSLKSDTLFQSFIKTYKSQLNDEMNEVVAVCDEALVVRKPESELVNFISDAMLEIARDYCREKQLSNTVDLSIMNRGGIRTALPKGEISRGKIYEMLPFKNELVLISMKGEDLKELLDQIARSGGEGIGGLTMGIKNREAIDVLIDGKAIQSEQEYYIITIDYLVNGGGGFTAFEKRTTFRHLHMKLRDAIIGCMLDHYKKGEHISAKLDGRIYHVE